MENTIQAHQKDLLAERERVKALLDIGRQYNAQDIALRLIENGGSLEDMRAQVLAKLNAGGPPQPLSLGQNTGMFGGGTSRSGPFLNFGEQLRQIAEAGRPGGRTDPRLFQNAAGMHEQVGSEGGFAIQADFSTALLDRVHDTSTVPGLCTRIPVAGYGLTLPIIDESTRATGSRWGGVQVEWTAEGGSPTAKKPKLAQLNLKLNKMMGLAYASDELLQDQAALEMVITKSFREELLFVLTDSIINGSGAGLPLGILNADCLVTVSKEIGQTADSLQFENIVNMWSRMWGPGRQRAVWLINSQVEPQLLTMGVMVGTAGYPAYLPATGAAGSPYNTLLGRPVIPCEQCAALGDVGDIILADLSQYIIAEKAMTNDVSMHARFIYDEMTFRFTYRVDGQPAWKDALTPYKGSATVSPFVALAAR